jgi:hypothetical protein
MLLRELKNNNFNTFSARVKVRHPRYSQWIDVQISAKNAQEARKLLLAQYGPQATIAKLVKA